RGHGALLRRGRHRAGPARAHSDGAAPHLPVLAPLPRAHGRRESLSLGAGGGPWPLRPAAPTAAAPVPRRPPGSPRPRAPRGGGRPTGGLALPRPAAPARDRHGTGGSAAPH